MPTENSVIPGEEQPGGRSRWLDRGLLLAAVLAAAVAMSPSQADPDLWGHVRYGRDALARGIPAAATYSYTAVGYPWINHENLSEIIFALVDSAAGGPGLLILKCLVGVAVIGLILRRAARKGVALVPACVVLLLVAVNLAYRWAVRPQIFTCLLLAALVALVSWCFEGWEGRWNLPWLRKLARAPDCRPVCSSRRMRWLWLAPVIFAVWANTHGGFVAGYCIFTAILVLRAVEVLAMRGRRGFGIIRRLAMMIVAAGLATFLNPYGPRLHLWLLGTLGRARPEIMEWAGLSVASYPFYPFLLLAIAMSAALVLSRRSLDFTHVAVLALVAVQAVLHERHVAMLAILFGFWMPGHVESMLARFRRRSSARREGQPVVLSVASPLAKCVFAVGLCLAYVLLGARLYRRLDELQVRKDRFPVAAVRYLAERKLKGRLLVTYNWAQYAIAALGPQSPGDDGLLVGFDGRFRTCYPQEIVDMHFDFVLGNDPPVRRNRSPHSPPPDPSLALRFGSPDLVLVNRKQPHSIEVLRRHSDEWVLLYQDGLAQVWGRASKYDDPKKPDYIPVAQRVIGDGAQRGIVSWPALPQRGRHEENLAAL